MDTDGRKAGALPWLLAALFYVGFTVVQTWPRVTRLGLVIPHDPGDPILNTWILWWNVHAVPLTARWWNAPAFLAVGRRDGVLGSAARPRTDHHAHPVAGRKPRSPRITSPSLLTFPLSALAAHALVYRLTEGRHTAAFVGGLVYGFNPFRIAHFPQIPGDDLGTGCRWRC